MGEAAGAAGTYSLTFPIWNKNRQPVRLLKLDAPCVPLHQAERSMQALLDLYQNHLNLIEDSELDALTGLRNRRTFDHLLLNLLAGNAAVEQAPAGFRRLVREDATDGNWLAVLDIDRFKLINDRYGHLFGDEVLILIANLMNKSFRAHDPLFRFGGEEFVIVLCGVEEAGANTALERFRGRLESQRFPQVGQITISTGFTQIREGELTSEVLNRADAALYYAKAHGRNRTCCFERLVEDGLLSPLQRSAGSGFELF
jgi:diguanylate cyclase (GGDEF)-like protein